MKFTPLTFLSAGWLALEANLALGASIPTTSNGLPVVDLGYAIHRATTFNTTDQTFQFRNIRYAAPPIGDLRFQKPQLPGTNRSAGIQTGEVGLVCPQSIPSWIIPAAEGLLGINATKLGLPSITIPGLDIPLVETEDCLFLDVYVPANVFQEKDNGKGAPVIAWIFGGGYVANDKLTTLPGGLMNISESTGSEGAIFVALNYRLGAFGWLGGDSVQADGVANAGLYDQFQALQWIQDNIHLFGGDPRRVTVMGESAGAGSIMHQIVSHGGKNNVSSLYHQAILQSTAWQPLTNAEAEVATTQSFLKAAGVSTIAEARKLDSDTLIKANFDVVSAAPYANFVYGPSIDGTLIQDSVGKLLLEGKFNSDLKLMIGHNENEGTLFTPNNITTDADVAWFANTLFPTAKSDIISYILDTLYPATYDGTYPWTTPQERAKLLVEESDFSCATNAFARAFDNETYNYMFSVSPGIHGIDLLWTFYDGPGLTSLIVKNGTVATDLQSYITAFASNGNPNSDLAPQFNAYGSDSMLQNLNVTGIGPLADPTANNRCQWWQQGLYF
ncbi:MAG: hypothetical protein M1819_000794 [Sarea resinae]|nr:MAG: hypothetical protein M1819_000794 [Sarea resinae]